MVVLWMAVFFLLSVAFAASAVFPETRNALAASLGRAWGRLAAAGDRVHAASGRHAGAVGRALADRARSGWQVARNNRITMSVALALLLAPCLVVLTTRPGVLLEEPDPEVAAADRHVVELLRGERLAPPPGLPPAVFTAAEAEVQRSGTRTTAPQAIASADRRWEKVDPTLRQSVLAVHRAMARQGYRMVLVEGYRTPERQAMLAQRGTGTTLAGAGQSCHQYGLAVDSALYRDGRLQWDMEDPWTRRGYLLYGRLAAEAGLEWGGNWRRLRDYVHVEMRDACRRARRAAGH